MYEKILVPLDGSERAEAILPHVEELAACDDVQIILLQVVEPGAYYVSPYDAYPEPALDDVEARADLAQEYLDKWVTYYQAKDISVQSKVEHGPVVLAILDVADREDVDLIAMASHGRTGLARVFYGSVAAGILNRIDRPLLLVRAQ